MTTWSKILLACITSDTFCIRCNVATSSERQREKKKGQDKKSEKFKQTAGEAAHSKEQKSVWDGVFLAQLPEALHIPPRLIEAVSVFVFSASELPLDYGETAVRSFPPDSACVIMHRLTTRTNSQRSPGQLRQSFLRLVSALSISQTATHLHTDWQNKSHAMITTTKKYLLNPFFFVVLVSQSCSNTCIYKEIVLL